MLAIELEDYILLPLEDLLFQEMVDCILPEDGRLCQGSEDYILPLEDAHPFLEWEDCMFLDRPLQAFIDTLQPSWRSFSSSFQVPPRFSQLHHNSHLLLLNRPDLSFLQLFIRILG
jgi:hypothetical protein